MNVGKNANRQFCRDLRRMFMFTLLHAYAFVFPRSSCYLVKLIFRAAIVLMASRSLRAPCLAQHMPYLSDICSFALHSIL